MVMDGVEHSTDQKGNFEIDGVLPGAYTLSAALWSEQHAMSARQDVDVGENDVDNLVLVLAGGSPLSGRVAVESGTPPNLDSVTVFLQPQDQTRQITGGLYDHLHDGAFSMSDVLRRSTACGSDGLPDGYWVKSIRMGDQEAKQSGLDLTRGPGDTVTVNIAPNAAQIDGAVMNDKQQPAAGVTVVLVPEPKLREIPEAYKTTTSDQNGRFSLKNLDPGDYKLFAWEDVDTALHGSGFPAAGGRPRSAHLHPGGQPRECATECHSCRLRSRWSKGEVAVKLAAFLLLRLFCCPGSSPRTIPASSRGEW